MWAQSTEAADTVQPQMSLNLKHSRPSQQAPLTSNIQNLRIQTVRDSNMLGIAFPEEDDVYLTFVGLQPTGTFVAVYTASYEHRNSTSHDNRTIISYSTQVYLIPPEAVSPAQVTSFVINGTDCAAVFFSDDSKLVWRPDGKVLLAVFSTYLKYKQEFKYGIMVLDFVSKACYPCGGVGGLKHSSISKIAFSPDSTRLLVVLNQTTVATLDTTQGMAKAQIIPPMVQLPESYIGFFNFPVTSNGSIALMGGTSATHANNNGRPSSRDDDEYPDNFQSLALVPVAPGTQPIEAVASSVFFSAVFTLGPVALFGGRFLVSASVTDTTIAVQTIATQTGMIAGRVLIDKPNGTSQQYGLQLCSLSENEAVLIAGGYVYLISVSLSGTASGNATQVTVQDGVPVGVLPVSGCTSRQGGASYVGLYGESYENPTIFTLLSKV